MRAVLSLFLSALLCTTNFAYAKNNEQIYQIDKQATSQAPWKVGDVIAEDHIFIGAEGMFDVYRKFMGLTKKGFFVVQDFYKENNKKMSDPIAITQQDFVTDIKQSYANKPFDGMLIVWYENGQKSEEVLLKVEKLQGLWTTWYSNGKKMSQSQYQGGKKNGSFTVWNNNGQQRIKGEFQDGEEEGRWTEWYSNGQKMLENHYRNGKEHGHLDFWYENGQKSLEIQLQDGKQQGLGTRWHENGEKMLQGKYQDGLRQGLWIEWNEEGKKISETVYENGEVVSEKTFD